jgi:tagaturonate reductase
MNGRGLFLGRAVLVQPIANGMADALNDQQGLYTVLLRGIERGQVRETREIVSSVSRCLNPYTDFDAFLECAKNPDLRFVVSNTTEAGIRTDPADRLDARPAVSFPAKLTQLLYARFQHFAGDPARGLVMLPCELIEQNGRNLERAVHETADGWGLPEEFKRFLTEACLFTSTLVDRIVTGYPKDEAKKISESLGYEDPMLVTGELFHSWVIESPRPLEGELPLREAGLNVVWTTDISPYRERKVRILNGAHTMTVLAAYLAGKETVRDCMDDPLFLSFVERGVEDEILPTLKLARSELVTFAEAVIERFHNPFIRHYLLSIALNSVSKYKARILGTVMDYSRDRGALPPRLTFALAALIVFYRGSRIEDSALIGERNGVPYRIQDDPGVLEFFRDAWAGAGTPNRDFCSELVRRVLSRTDFWGEDLNVALPKLRDAVAEHVYAILNAGVRAALEKVAR